MTRLPCTIAGLALATTVVAAGSAEAQPLGTFQWQLQPFCNLLTVNLTQQGAVYTVDGFDDQCGAPQRAALVGLATPNPDGTIGLGLNIVTAPGGRGVQVDGRISLPSGSGQWTDSAGNAGIFAFGASTGGSPRPPVTVGASVVDPAQVQLRVSGACPPGQLIKEVRQNGTVICGPGLKTGPNGGFDLSNPGGLVASTDPIAGGTIAQGPGRRLLYYPAKDAFRVGQVTGTQWDDVNIGQYSIAMGFDTAASGYTAVALGRFSVASGHASLAMGNGPDATGQSAVALGDQTVANGDSSVALGFKAFTLDVADGSFVFADRSSNNTFTSFAPNEFVVRAAGGVGFYTNGATTTGVELAKNGSSWASLSDVNAKENFREVAGEDVLAKIAGMSIQEWNYKAQDASIRHMGPTAQDFRAAFGLGDFPLRINTVDADGVALAAVKALEARTRATNERLTRENDELRARLARLEVLLDKR